MIIIKFPNLNGIYMVKNENLDTVAVIDPKGNKNILQPNESFKWNPAVLLYNSSDRGEADPMPKIKSCANCLHAKLGLLSFYCEQPYKDDKELHRADDTCDRWEFKKEPPKPEYKYPEWDGD